MYRADYTRLTYVYRYIFFFECPNVDGTHGLQTPNEDINQRILKIWADMADKICFGRI